MKWMRLESWFQKELKVECLIEVAFHSIFINSWAVFGLEWVTAGLLQCLSFRKKLSSFASPIVV
jgi:hypothetical protein